MADKQEEERMINLKSSDGDIFNVKRKLALRSKLINSMLEDGIIIDDEEPVPLMNVDSKTLEKIVEWLNHHENDPVCTDQDCKEDEGDEFTEMRRTDDIEEWDMKFLDVDHGVLFKLIIASNYMDIKPLLDVSCKTVANLLKGKTPDEIRKTFHVTNTFTQEEIEMIKRENEWCESE